MTWTGLWLLAERRKLLLPQAPIFWRSSEHAAQTHRAYLARRANRGWRQRLPLVGAVAVSLAPPALWRYDARAPLP